MPNDFEAAALCLDVYRSENRPPLPDGWSIYKDYNPFPPYPIDDGYFGSCYVKPSDLFTGAYDIVFAHRGTIVSGGDIFTDISIALEMIPIQYANAFLFVKETTKNLVEQYGEEYCLISHTGHSLGAILAEIFSAFFKEFDFTRRIVTFESPGSKPIMQKMINLGLLPSNALTIASQVCWIIHAGMNIINTCNEQVASVMRARMFDYKYTVYKGPDLAPEKNYYLNFYYILGYTIEDQHKIEYIYDWLKKGFNVSVVGYSYPIGFDSGYVAYLNYNMDVYSYWDGYITEIWDAHPEIRAEYNGNFSSYQNFFENSYLTNNSNLKVKEKIEFELKSKLSPSDFKNASFVRELGIFKNNSQMIPSQKNKNFNDKEEIETYSKDVSVLKKESNNNNNYDGQDNIENDFVFIEKKEEGDVKDQEIKDRYCVVM